MISVKIGVRCDDHRHVGEKPETLLDAELSPDGLVKLPRSQDGWTIEEDRYDRGVSIARCPACALREIEAFEAMLRGRGRS